MRGDGGGEGEGRKEIGIVAEGGDGGRQISCVCAFL